MQVWNHIPDLAVFDAESAVPLAHRADLHHTEPIEQRR